MSASEGLSEWLKGEGLKSGKRVLLIGLMGVDGFTYADGLL